jgi:potassium efflux system protein
VRTFEGAEVIVPNGTLIADSVTNWTLSDRMRRIDLPVSVAYGNDPEHVLHTLRTLATSQPAVVHTPAPTAIFVGFGDAALNFELRVWTDRFEQWVAIRSELVLSVFQGLPRAGIALPTVPRELYRGREAPDGGGAARSDNGGR